MSAGSAILCYDTNGNMTQKIDGSSTSYTYDAKNRMTAVSEAATATFSPRKPGVKSPSISARVVL